MDSFLPATIENGRFKYVNLKYLSLKVVELLCKGKMKGKLLGYFKIRSIVVDSV